ncbi:MAG: cupin domain-containing protein [Acutalibacteraceae bacterium]
MRRTWRRAAISVLLVLTMLFACISASAAGLREWLPKCIGDPNIVRSKDDLNFPLGDRLPEDAFHGEAYLKELIRKDTTYNFPQTNNITFAPGAHSNWHTHGGMVLLVTGGVGYYQEEGKPAQIIRKGDVVNIPAGVKHWHGATPYSWFSQIVIYDVDYQPTRTDGNEVLNDSDYQNIESEDYADRTAPDDSDVMFEKGAEPVTMPTFTGPVYLSQILGADNAAGAQPLYNVVFTPGTINNWHTHPGGQILIATDGVGYTQIEGQKVQVMHPGDVAFCPPGAKHWHSGSRKGTFAHIAIETNSQMGSVKWENTHISDEEYNALPTA